MKLKLEFPLKNIVYTQRFGKNGYDVYATLGLVGHNGIDFRAPDGTPVMAAHDGRVVYAGYDGAGGLTIVIRTEQEYEYNGGMSFFKTIYCHLKRDTLKVTGGQTVKVGQVIALADNTGLSTGSHLHFGLKPIYKGEQDWQWENLENDNGFRGAIDPAIYLPSLYVPFPKIIKEGQSGDDVERLQAFLIRKGLLKMPIGVALGFYGELTKKAVKDYQIANGIAHNNGVQVGPKTLEKLNAQYDL